MLRNLFLLLPAVAAPALVSPATAMAQTQPAAATLTAPTITIPAGAGRLGYFADKVRRKQPVTMVAIGGSITQGSGASGINNAYIWKFVSKFKTAVAQRGSTMKFEWAPAGGTNSTYGAHRIGAQLFKLNPDLLLIEFAVNDGANPQALDGMEGIVRQALRVNPRMGIVFFSTTSATYEKNAYSQDTLPKPVQTHEKVAQHYNLAHLNAGPAVHAELVKGGTTPEAFWKDGTHPSDLGHDYYHQLLVNAMVPTLDHPTPAGDVPPVPAPLGNGQLEGARFNPIEPQGATEGWTMSEKDWFKSQKWSATEVKPLSFPLSGKDLSIVFRGTMNLRWKKPDGSEGTGLIRPNGPMPSPGQYHIPGGSLPAGTIATVEPVPSANGKIESEVYGVFSLKAADAPY